MEVAFIHAPSWENSRPRHSPVLHAPSLTNDSVGGGHMHRVGGVTFVAHASWNGLKQEGSIARVDFPSWFSNAATRFNRSVRAQFRLW